MHFIKIAFIVVMSICLVSCNWRTNNKPANEISTVEKDTNQLINLLKSYEPPSVKGKVAEQFYKDRGFYDWWRFPLVYPYSINCIDVTEYGAIYSDRDRINYDEGGSRQALTSYFDKFIFDKHYFIGSTFKDPFENDTIQYVEQYFIFSFTDGTIEEISGNQHLKRKLKTIKFNGDKTFMTIKDYRSLL